MILMAWRWMLLGVMEDVHSMVIERPSSSRGRRSDSGGTSKNKDWYTRRRNQGIKVPRRGKKPPQWEKEGDALYQEIVQDNPYRTTNEKITLGQAQQLLLEKLNRDHNEEKNSPPEAEQLPLLKSTLPLSPVKDEPPFMWGGLSVGPFWKQRLIQAGFAQPTPIQSAAFAPIIQSKENLILASATGSGKSLAYLLPLLTTRQQQQSNKEESTGRIWIMTPTTELALQLQRMVATLLEEDLDISLQSPTVHVLCPSGATKTADDDDDNNNQMDDEPLLSSLMNSSSYFLAGTPRMFQQLLDEIEQPIIVNKKLRQLAKNLLRNLQTLVFDEADRLFQTEAVARTQQEKIRQRQQRDNRSTPKPSTKQRRLSTTPLSLELLEFLVNRLQHSRSHSYRTSSPRLSSSSPPGSVKFICASATVGRTLRRQLMDTLQTTSMEKAATLITVPIRTKKDALARKASLLPLSLQHAYRLLPEECDDSSTSAAKTLVSSVVETLQGQLKAAPALIFPGRTGVTAVQAELRECGWEQVYGLDDVAQRLTEDGSLEGGWKDWKRTPIFVVSEKLGRGLDIPQLGYVLLLQVPSSAAGYTHLAGRTGRNDRVGTAVTFCRAREAPKLVVIAETLGIDGFFQSLG